MIEFKLPVLVMAGSDRDEKDILLEYAGVEYKSLIELNGEPILSIILKELQKTGLISKYYIVGIPKDVYQVPEELKAEKVEFLETIGKEVPERLTIASNHAINQSKSDPLIFPLGNTMGLMVTGDIPFIKSGMVKDYMNQVKSFKYGFYPTAVEEKDMIRRFPTSKRTYGKLRDGNYCMGDIACFDYELVEERIKTVTKLRNNRKKFVRAIISVKPSVIFKYIFKRMKVKDIEDAASKVLKVPTKFVIVKWAELAMDVDKPFQLDLVRNEFANLSPQTT